MTSSLAKTIPPYRGLSQEFAAQCREMCARELSLDVWLPWHDLTVGKKKFPVDGTQTQKAEFIDHYLYALLAPCDVTLPNRRMIPRIRADLNKYRGWLLHRLLLQIGEMGALKTDDKGDKKPSTKTYKYILPEDFPKIVDDLYLFHKHINGDQSNIATCSSLDKLWDMVDKFRPAYPISHQERAEAHATYLITDTPEELEKLLPEGWSATKTTVTTPDGRTIERLRGAKLIDVLEDGTEIIRLLTEKASRAYGSPRWCTAYRERRTYFSQYKNDLLVIFGSDGQRWQLHPPTGMYKDATDSDIKLTELFDVFSGLEETLIPFFLKTNDMEKLEKFFTDAAPYRTASTKNISKIAKAMCEQAGSISTPAITKLLMRYLASPEGERMFVPYLSPLITAAMKGKNPDVVAAVLGFACQRSVLWTEALKDRVDTALYYLATNQDLYRRRVTEIRVYDLFQNIRHGVIPEWQVSEQTRERMMQRMQPAKLPALIT